MSSILTGVSLFTGAGGMDIGFEEAGFEVVLANEIMKEASDTYNANHKHGIMINDDIYNVMDLFPKFKGANIVFGGPPCQGFSVAGKMDPNDNRSKLIFTFLDVVKEVQPEIFVMENVKALGVLGKWSDVRKRYLEKVNDIGYKCFYIVLNATEFDVPQKRERVIFIGTRLKDENFEKTIKNLILGKKHQADNIRKTLVDLGKAGTDKNPNTCTAKITFATHPIMRKTPYSGMYFNGQGRPIDVDSYANTLPASMGGNKTPFVDEEYLYGNATSDWVKWYHDGLVSGSIIPEFKEAPNRLRRITIKEAARIQTFPDSYILKGNKGKIYTQIGNAVPCNLAKAVGESVAEYLHNI